MVHRDHDLSWWCENINFENRQIFSSSQTTSWLIMMWNHDRSWTVVSITIVVDRYLLWCISWCEKYKWERQDFWSPESKPTATSMCGKKGSSAYMQPGHHPHYLYCPSIYCHNVLFYSDSQEMTHANKQTVTQLLLHVKRRAILTTDANAWKVLSRSREMIKNAR